MHSGGGGGILVSAKGGARVEKSIKLPIPGQRIVRSVLADRDGFSIEHERQIFPSEGGPDGFYTCLIRRSDDKRRL